MNPLVTPAALTGDEVLLDVRWSLTGPPGRDLYDQGHLPGAHYVDLDTELAAPVGDGTGGRHPLPSLAVLRALVRRTGIRADRDVVVYDAADGTAAARAWWLLRWAGHTRVRLLDGGYRAWVASGGAVSTAVPAAEAGTFEPTPGGMPTLTAAEIPSYAGTLVDARTAVRYRGEREPIDPVAGHIPGAVNLPTTDNVTPEGTFRTDLESRFGTLSGNIAVYCGSGITAAHEVLALELAGIPAALYPGSWSEWITDPSRPVATGDV